MFHKATNERQKSLAKMRSCFTSLPNELFAFSAFTLHDHAYGEQLSSGILWPERIRDAFDGLNTFWTDIALQWYQRCVGPTLPNPAIDRVCNITDRLGMSLEGGLAII